MRRFAGPRDDQAVMRSYFDTQFASEHSIPLLKFYERYYRDFYKELRARQRKAPESPEPNTFGGQYRTEGSRQRASGLREFVRFVTDRIAISPTAEEVVLTSADLSDLSDRVPDVSAPTGSMSVFCHFLPPGAAAEPWRLVVPAGRICQGYGKFFSRFLHLLEPGVLARLRARSRVTHSITAEIEGDDDFNANLHPQILDWLIEDPTAPSLRSSGQTLRCSDLEIDRDPEDPEALRLMHRPTGKAVSAVDLGFLALRRRSALHQLLTMFQKPSNIQVPEDRSGLTFMTDPTEWKDVNRVIYRPRITIDGRVVVARRTWLIPHGALPVLSPSLTATQRFLEIQRWRAVHASYAVEERIVTVPEGSGCMPVVTQTVTITLAPQAGA
jgi:hypothetical protein